MNFSARKNPNNWRTQNKVETREFQRYVKQLKNGTFTFSTRIVTGNRKNEIVFACGVKLNEERALNVREFASTSYNLHAATGNSDNDYTDEKVFACVLFYRLFEVVSKAGEIEFHSRSLCSFTVGNNLLSHIDASFME